MSNTKINATHGSRGPRPKTFQRWCLQVTRRGAKKFRVTLGDGTTKLVAHKSAPDTARRIQDMTALKVEALDDEGAELGAWSFAADELELEPEPGYTKEEGDTEIERTLKTFAHLLADAHRLASHKLVEVVGIQARHFAEERKNLLAMQLAADRMRRRLPARVRVAEPNDGDEEDEEEETTEPQADNFMSDLLQPVIQRMVGQQLASLGTTTKAEANGAADAPPQKGKSS